MVWGARVPRHGTLVIRSTWDYVDDPNRFVTWLGELDADDVTVFNPTSLLRWNLHKRYMVELGQRGVSIVPTVVVPKRRVVDLGELMRRHGWDDAVIKPAIGGTARLALHVGDCEPDAAQRHLDGMLAHEDALVQRFIPSILSTGETSVIAIGGVITHAVQKRAPGATGEFKPSSGGASSWSTSATPSRRPPDARSSLCGRHRCTHESISSRPPAASCTSSNSSSSSPNSSFASRLTPPPAWLSSSPTTNPAETSCRDVSRTERDDRTMPSSRSRRTPIDQACRCPGRPHGQTVDSPSAPAGACSTLRTCDS